MEMFAVYFLQAQDLRGAKAEELDSLEGECRDFIVILLLLAF